MGTEAFADEAINRKWDEETAFRVCGTGLRTDGRRTGIPNYARALPVRHVAGRSDGGLDHQQARAFVGRSVARRQPCARTAAAPLPDRRRPQAGRQDAARRSCPGAATRDRLPLPDLFAGGSVVARRQQRHLWKDCRRRCVAAPGLRVPYLSGCGFRMLVPRAERHPRQGRRPDPALQARGLFRTGIRGFQRRHVEQRRERGAAFQGLPRRFGRAFRRRNADSLHPRPTAFIATATSASCCSTAARTSPTTMRSTTGWPITTPTAPRSARG